MTDIGMLAMSGQVHNWFELEGFPGFLCVATGWKSYFCFYDAPYFMNSVFLE